MDQHIFTSDTATSQGRAQSVGHGIVQSLAALWPSLPALLLAGAVRRLCHSRQPNQQGSTTHSASSSAAAWVQLLLAMPTEAGQQLTQTPTHTRGGKRKSMSSDGQAATAVEQAGNMPTAAQLRACIEECLVAVPQAQDEAASALRQVLSLLTGQLKHKHMAEYIAWGGTAEQLAGLWQPATRTGAPEDDIAAVQGSGDELHESALLEAKQKQQQILQNLTVDDAATASERR